MYNIHNSISVKEFGINETVKRKVTNLDPKAFNVA